MNNGGRMITLAGVDPNMIANNLEPLEPTHPGSFIKDEIECRGISQKQLASDMGVSYVVLNDMLNEKRAVSPQYALLFEAALGIPDYILAGMQSDYDMIHAKQNKTFMEKLKRVRRVAAVL